MYKVGQIIDVTGSNDMTRVQEDEKGNLFIVHPTSGHKTILVPGEHRQDLIGGETVETGTRDFNPFRAREDARIYPGDITQSEQESILNSLIGAESGMSGGQMENGHSSIDGLMMENELSNIISQPPGSRVRGPLDAIGHTLAEYLIGQNPETGEIPEQEHPYNPMLNLITSLIK